MTGKLDVTRRGALGLVLGAPVLFGAVGAALASAGTGKNSADAGPGSTVVIPTSRTRYTWVKFTNLGPGVAEIEVSSRLFNEVFVIAEGGTVEISENFGTRKTRITNNSATATVKIDSLWL